MCQYLLTHFFSFIPFLTSLRIPVSSNGGRFFVFTGRRAVPKRTAAHNGVPAGYDMPDRPTSRLVRRVPRGPIRRPAAAAQPRRRRNSAALSHSPCAAPPAHAGPFDISVRRRIRRALPECEKDRESFPPLSFLQTPAIRPAKGPRYFQVMEKSSGVYPLLSTEMRLGSRLSGS